MFFDKTKKLNLEARVHSSERSFNEIPIWMPGSGPGFGDIMTTLKLAEGLKLEFPNKKVTIYFGKEDDYNTLRKLYSHFDSKELEFCLNGISVAQVSENGIRKIMSKSLIGIYTPITMTELPPFQDIMMDAEINLYIEEYNGMGNIRLFLEIKRNIVHADMNGRKHLILSTGFDDESIGIHIDSSLTQLPTKINNKIKESLLQNANFQWIKMYIPDLMQSEWGLAYYVKNHHFRTDAPNDSYLKSLLKYLKNITNRKRSITIFDFSNVNPCSIEEYKYEPFCDIFLQENGQAKLIKGNKFDMSSSKVYIVHVGSQKHSTFLDFLRYSELPVAITGDCSLSEAISFNKTFFYAAPRWKKEVFPAFINLAADYLDNWEDINRIGSLISSNKINEEKFRKYNEFKKIHLDLFYPEANNSHKLFYDSSYKDSFHRYNQALIQKMNISKNLANIIKEAVQQYNRD